MASAADPPSSTHSPRSARAATRSPSSPWSHVVRGEPDAASAASAAPPPLPLAAPITSPEPSDRSSPKPVEDVASSSDAALPPLQSDSPDYGSNDNATAAAARGKKPAWNMPSNGSVEVGPVMGAVSWPALSEATRASPKSSSSDSLKALSDGSVSAPTGPAISSPSPKPSMHNPNPNSAPNHAAPARQKSMKRTSGGAGSSGTLSNGGPALPSPLPPPPTVAETPAISPDKQAFSEPSPKGQPNNSTSTSSNNLDHGVRGGGFTPPPHGSNDHHRSYSGNRRGNNGGPHHNNYGNRRDQERGSYEWNHRNFSGRDVHMQQPPPPRGVRPYLRPPATVSAPFIGPPPQVRPFASPMVYPDMPSPVYYVAAPPPPESLRGVPFVAHPAPAMFFPTLDPQRAMLLKQIDYYFSHENLCKDIYLRKNMDDQGWVPISLIAGFNRVKQLANNIQYILDTVRLSTVVEVQGEKIRRRSDWMNWVLPPSPNHFGNTTGSQSPATTSYDTLAAHFQTVGLEGATYQNSMRGSSSNEVVLSRSASGNLKSQSPIIGDLNGDGNAQVAGHIDSDRSKYARSLVRSDTL